MASVRIAGNVGREGAMLEDKAVNAQRARDIVDAAYQVMLEDGFSGASIRKIAGRAGVSKYMIHYYFEDKEALLVEVVREVVAGINEIIAEIFRKYPTNSERIEKGVKEFWGEFKKDPGPLAILQESVIQGRRIPEINRRIIGFYRGVVERLAEDIAADPSMARKLSKEEAKTLVVYLFATLDGLALQYMRDPELLDFEMGLDLLIRSLRDSIS